MSEELDLFAASDFDAQESPLAANDRNSNSDDGDADTYEAWHIACIHSTACDRVLLSWLLGEVAWHTARQNADNG